MENLPISVVIVARNAEITIKDCLDSVQRNSPAEIIVVDGVSNDRTVEVAKEYTQRVYSDEGKGLNYARQLGAEQATQRYISYIDSDIVLPPGTLAKMLDEFQASGYAAIWASIKSGEQSNYWERATQEHIQIIQSRHNVLGLASSLFRRETILKYRFDFSFPRLDDVDLVRKMSKDGHGIGVSSAFVYNAHKLDLKGFYRQRFVNGRAKAQLLWKYGPFNPAGWAPLATAYMLGWCLIKGRLNLIPYFLLDGIIETAGMIKGFFELTGLGNRAAGPG